MQLEFDQACIQTLGYYRCRTCGSTFYGPGRAIHEPVCPDIDYQNCSYVIGRLPRYDDFPHPDSATTPPSLLQRGGVNEFSEGKGGEKACASCTIRRLGHRSEPRM
jgi:hypothetical protein